MQHAVSSVYITETETETETEFIAKFKKLKKIIYNMMKVMNLAKGTRRSELINAGPIVSVHKLIFFTNKPKSISSLYTSSYYGMGGA